MSGTRAITRSNHAPPISSSAEKPSASHAGHRRIRARITARAASARAGAVLRGGGRRGVREAASRGAARAGGTVVGLLPGFSRSDANRWVTIPIVTGMDQARNVVLVRSCDAIVAVGGAYGTL